MRFSLTLILLLALAADGAAQSLWTGPGAQERSWTADLVALRVGDIITVVINEQSFIQDDGRTELTKESELDTAIEVLDIDDDLINTLPAVKYSHQRLLNGETRYEQNARWQTTVSCVVIDVKPNGNLLIEGRRALHLDAEYKDVRVRGLVRPVDINSDNTVNSDRIANAGLLYDTEGERSYHTEKNWLEVLLDWIWPF